jgi:hypothetical protein
MVGRNGPAVGVSMRHVVLPVLGVLILTVGAMGFYNLRVTGDALHLPYQVHEATYAMAPLFLWQSPRPEPPYRHKELRAYHIRWVESYRRKCTVQQCSLLAFVQSSIERVKTLWRFYLGPVLIVPLVTLPWVLRNHWMRFALLICSSSVAASFLTTWSLPHYIAPATGLIFVLVLQAMRQLRLWRWRGKPTGQFIVRAIPALHAVFLLVLLMRWTLGPGPGPTERMRTNEQTAWSLQRAHMLAQLQQDGQRHVVIVRHGPAYPPDRQWVYNEADIDGAKVVWAREMDAAQNRRLLQYFRDRRAWLLELDAKQPKLVRYPIPMRP